MQKLRLKEVRQRAQYYKNWYSTQLRAYISFKAYSFLGEALCFSVVKVDSVLNSVKFMANLIGKTISMELPAPFHVHFILLHHQIYQTMYFL